MSTLVRPTIRHALRHRGSNGWRFAWTNESTADSKSYLLIARLCNAIALAPLMSY